MEALGEGEVKSASVTKALNHEGGSSGRLGSLSPTALFISSDLICIQTDDWAEAANATREPPRLRHTSNHQLLYLDWGNLQVKDVWEGPFEACGNCTRHS